MLRRCLLVVLLLAAAPAAAQEWFEAYREGLRALEQGQPQKAAGLLESAARQRPQPGRNILTYGTNVEHAYFPYIHLAEAYLQLRDVPAARSALKRSEAQGREPAEERRRLLAQVEELATRLTTPAPSLPSATAAPTTAPEPATAPATPLPQAAHASHPEDQVLASAQPPTAPRGASAEPRRPSAPPASAPVPGPVASPPPLVATGVLEVVSQPPGASVYLDDELIGTTDPEWGRLVRTAIPAGKHRLRLALSGHQDVVEDVLVGAATTDFRRRLGAQQTAFDRRLVLFATVAAILLGLTAWALRRPQGPAEAAARTPVMGTLEGGTRTFAHGTPPGHGSPGVRRDAKGLDHFGDYRLIAPLGRGGMASVFKAERRGETVALKRPLAAFLEEPEFLERFLREAEIGRTLHHPNIVRILERGEVEGVPYFTMELVPGETLQAELQRVGFLDPRVATERVVQIAEALDYAHLKGVVHRDLKPSNVMVLPDGAIKVMDYGIARARRFEGLTVTGSFLGSPEYVAPEAIEGQSDARGDLYSLGVLFYEALTGQRPFTAGTPFAILRMHLTEAPPPLDTLRPDLPAELQRIVMRLLSKSPEQRHTGAEELVLELRDFLNRAA